ncbi:MAG: S-layer homology domain-containing protein, partial [Clostridia bacterium]|nr:S-layer homology domain-containing protein [Clostridia bacterium]
VKMPAPFDGDAYQWIKLRIRNRSEAEVFEFHFASAATEAKTTAATCTHFPISKGDTEYKEYVFNIKEYNLKSQNVNEDVSLTESVWAGEISSLRFDFMWVAEPSGQVPNNSEMDIQYIGFFATEADAKAHVFTEAGASTVEGWDESYAWILDNAFNAGVFSASNCETAIEFGALKVIPTNGDPMLIYNFPADAVLPNTNEYRYFALRLKTKSTVDNGALFVSTDVNTAFSGEAYNSFILSNTGDWQDIIIDMNTNNYWGDSNLTGFRVDPINALDLEADINVERVGFFKTSDEAINFLSEEIDEFGETHFKGETHKAIVPSGVLAEGYNKADYMLSNDVVLEGTTAENLPVVYYTDANGNSSVVPLCYCNPVGWTTYVANKAGKYTVAFNHKEYTDIAGHWGEKYISFVSDRTLFGGTSPTEFSPEETMTRGMFVTVLGRMHGLDTSAYDGNTGYADVPATEYYAPYIQWAKEIGIFAPVSETEFAPEAPITREVMAVVIANYVNAYNYSFVSNAEPIEFNDISGLSEASINAINAAQKAGIINGKGEGRFDPAGISTRAEVATVMQRVIKGILYIPSYNTTYDKDYFMRDRIRLGVWNFNANKFANEESVKLLSELGADFIVSAPSTGNASLRENLLNLTDKYGVETYVMDYGNIYNDPNNDDAEENFIT